MNTQQIIGRRIAGGAAGVFVLGLALAFPAAAKDSAKDVASRAAAFSKVADCRKITDPAARLACFDNTVAALDAAEKSGDVVVVDRAQIHQAKKQVFGLQSIEALNIFNRGDKNETIDKITDEITSASQNFDGRWVVVLKGGQVWSQSEAESFYPEPRAGDHIEIKRGMLGSYFVKINNNVSFKAHRDQ